MWVSIPNTPIEEKITKIYAQELINSVLPPPPPPPRLSTPQDVIHDHFSMGVYACIISPLCQLFYCLSFTVASG